MWKKRKRKKKIYFTQADWLAAPFVCPTWWLRPVFGVVAHPNRLEGNAPSRTSVVSYPLTGPVAFFTFSKPIGSDFRRPSFSTQLFSTNFFILLRLHRFYDFLSSSKKCRRCWSCYFFGVFLFTEVCRNLKKKKKKKRKTEKGKCCCIPTLDASFASVSAGPTVSGSSNSGYLIIRIHSKSGHTFLIYSFFLSFPFKLLTFSRLYYIYFFHVQFYHCHLMY
jgi:hypothetical protein